MTQRSFQHVGVVGAGAWGTALAAVCARAGRQVTLLAREPEVVRDVSEFHENKLFLSGIQLDRSIVATADPGQLAHCELILAVTPAQHLRASLKQLQPHISSQAPVVLCSKGIEQGSLGLMTEAAADSLPGVQLAVLSGPSFAAEVARNLPTAVTLACGDQALGADIVKAIATPTFRPYLAEDMIGAEAGGAVKNVLAIACGVAEGRGLGRSAHAALVTRGFAEMTRLAVALGAEAQTLAGLCGLGDLVLTCSSPQSRNMSVGLALGRGESLKEALSGKLSVAEGVASAPAVTALARKLGVDMPICETTADLLDGKLSVDEAMQRLLSRPLRTER
jgi:glycerol-3-phosphate dehydrogenase (NAD(P)+)